MIQLIIATLAICGLVHTWKREGVKGRRARERIEAMWEQNWQILHNDQGR